MTLHMISKTKLTFFMPGAGHIMYIPDPSFPNRAHFGSIDCTLALVWVGWIGNLPFTGSTGFARVFFFVELAFNRFHKKTPYIDKSPIWEFRKKELPNGVIL